MSGLVCAGIAHGPALAAIHAASFTAAERWTAAALAAQLGLPGAFALIEGEAGFVLARVAADEAEILTLAVLPQARRQGVARLLLCHAHTRAAGLGARSMLLEVAEANVAARGLYARFGYRQVGRRARYYPDGGDALVLCLDLSLDAATAE